MTQVSGLQDLYWAIPHPTVPALYSRVPALGWNKWSSLSHHLWVPMWSLHVSHTTTQRTSSGRRSGGEAASIESLLGWSTTKPEGNKRSLSPLAPPSSPGGAKKRARRKHQQLRPGQPSWEDAATPVPAPVGLFTVSQGKGRWVTIPTLRGPTSYPSWHRSPAPSAHPWSLYPLGTFWTPAPVPPHTPKYYAGYASSRSDRAKVVLQKSQWVLSPPPALHLLCGKSNFPRNDGTGSENWKRENNQFPWRGQSGLGFCV